MSLPSSVAGGPACDHCGALVGALHTHGCELEQCPECGSYLYSCGHDGILMHSRLPWTGYERGIAECHEFGFFCHQTPGRFYAPCGATAPDAMADLFRLMSEARWDAEAGRFVRIAR